MPRQNRRRIEERPERAPGTSLGERREDWRGLDYSVRTVSGSATGKSYRCPGYDQEVRGGNHVVVWPSDDVEAIDRRHWHTVCWTARSRRAPGIVRSRSAPRY